MFIEVRENLVRTGAPKLVPTRTLRPGVSPLVVPGGKVARYRSWFGYTNTTAGVITKQQNTADLKGLSVWADEVVIDVDTDTQVPAVRERLRQAGLMFTEWNTRRGRHFHIPIVPMWGVWVVNSIRLWLFSILDPEQFDHSMIHESGQIRAPYSVHDKDPTVIKYPVVTYHGTVPKIEFKQPTKVQTFTSKVEFNPDNEYDFIRQLDMARSVGGRTAHLYIIAKAGIRAGMSQAAVTALAKDWNKRYAYPPHPTQYVEYKIAEIYRRT